MEIVNRSTTPQGVKIQLEHWPEYGRHMIGADPPAGRMEAIKMKTKLDQLESRLNAAGIATRRNYIRTENGQTPVLIADHDYTGPYPTRETWGQISTVDRVAARYKDLRLERRGYYQATYIREEVTPA